MSTFRGFIKATEIMQKFDSRVSETSFTFLSEFCHLDARFSTNHSHFKGRYPKLKPYRLFQFLY
jgi:hypothetical protein